MYRSIVVPLDGSVFAESALPVALGIARRAGALLRVARVHVSPYTALEDLGGLVDRAAREEEHAYLKGVVNRLTEATAVPIESALLELPVAESLCEYASTARADLLVLTTHGRGPLARAWLGSVADEVVRKSSVPVLLARPREGRPSFDDTTVFRRILIPLDGSEFAEQIIERATAFGALSEAAFILVRVIEPLIRGGDIDARIAGSADPTLVRRLQAFHDEDRSAAGAYLARIATQLASRGLRAETQVVVSDQPAVAILDVAKKAEADVIALGTHGRRGLSRLVLGSVADKVLRGALIPVLIHRPVASETAGVSHGK